MTVTSKSEHTMSFSKNCRLDRRAAAMTSVLCLTALLLAGCQTQSQVIEQRISQKASFFAALPNDSQQRLREGKVKVGDTRDAVWIVYGKPDRVSQKVTATATCEVWSYVAPTPANNDGQNHAYYPANTSGGRTVSTPNSLWTSHTRPDTYEYLRIQFEGDRVSSIEFGHP